MFIRTSLKNTPARAIGGLSSSQETTPSLHPEVRREGVTPAGRESAIAQGVAALLPSRGVTPQSQCLGTASSAVPCEDAKIAGNAGRDIFEKGSSQNL
ncbi:MAG: hypothetical protein HZA25_02835 [Candidatus Niyogibacteria bacterium]|nr:hypothetical protein [Candidatus Niyogibacteria bacterium]